MSNDNQKKKLNFFFQIMIDKPTANVAVIIFAKFEKCHIEKVPHKSNNIAIQYSAIPHPLNHPHYQ
jgi:hypothetical protein